MLAKGSIVELSCATMEERSHPPTPRFARGCNQPQPRMAAPFTELDIFPALSRHWNGANLQTLKTSRRRRGLANLPFAFTMPSEAVEYVSDFSPTIPGSSASNFLDTLRNRTLLDLNCMREFSLLRGSRCHSETCRDYPSAPLTTCTQNSFISSNSRPQNLLKVPRRTTTTVLPSPVKQNGPELAGLRSRLVHAHRKILFAPGCKDDHGKKMSGTAARTFTVAPPPTKVFARSRQQQQKPKSQPPQRPRTEPTPKTPTVAEQHGFLQEQDLAALTNVTGYSRAELFARWARYKALCSMSKNSSGVDKETLRHGVPQLSVEDRFFVDRAFDVLDSDRSGALDWPEFIAALSALERGDANRRVDFLFRAYDLNGDGFIQRHEVQFFFLASLLVPQTPQALEVARHFVDKIFISLGRETQDTIRVQDAMAYLKEHPAADAYSLLGRTMVSISPATPVPRTRRSTMKTTDLEEHDQNQDEQTAESRKAG